MWIVEGLWKYKQEVQLGIKSVYLDNNSEENNRTWDNGKGEKRNAKLNKEENSQILIDDQACDRWRNQGFWVSNLDDCRDRAIHKHDKYRESGHLERKKSSSDLNVFILAFSATSRWRGQMILVPRTESDIDLELLGVLFCMCYSKNCPDEVIQGDIIEKASSGKQWRIWHKQKYYPGFGDE